MTIIHATNKSFDQDVKEGLVLVDFWAPWCGPCKMIAPVFDELDAESNGAFKIVKVNVDDEQEAAAKLGVMSIPTLYLFKDGEVVGQTAGFMPKEALQTFIDQHK